MLSSCTKDYENQLENDQGDVKLLLILHNNKHEKIILEADRNKLTQVISNLLSNAIKFTKGREGGGGTVFVIAERKEVSHILDSVKDTGIGIDPAILPRLFAKFATKSHHRH